MMDFTTHQLKTMSLNAARALRATCPVHKSPATGCVTTSDAKEHVAKFTFECGCTAVAKVK